MWLNLNGVGSLGLITAVGVTATWLPSGDSMATGIHSSPEATSIAVTSPGKFNRKPKTESKEPKPKPKEPEPKNSVPYSVLDIEEPK